MFRSNVVRMWIVGMLFTAGLVPIGHDGLNAARVTEIVRAPAPSVSLVSAWQNATRVVHGTPSWQTEFAYASALHTIIGVGPGLTPGSIQTWSYRGGSFVNLTPARSPPDAGLVVDDAAMGSVALLDAQTAPVTTWTFSNGNWSRLNTTPGPTLRGPTTWGATYDGFDGEIVVLAEGGFTWTLKGANWTNLSGSPGGRVVGSADRADLSLGYDSTDHVVVFFGNQSAPPADPSAAHAATWIFTGGNWTELCGSCAPYASQPFAFTDDPPIGGMIAFGGNGTRLDNETWAYQGGAWSRILGGSSPTPRIHGAFVYDAFDGYAVLYGGYEPDFPWTPYLECWWWGGPGLSHYTVTFHVHPANAGLVRWDNQSYGDNASARVTVGAYRVEFWPLGPTGFEPGQPVYWYRPVNWSVSPALTLLASTVYVNGSGGEVYLQLALFPTVSVRSEGCGPVALNGSAVPSGLSLNLPNSSAPVPVNATLCSAARFDGWSVQGGLQLADPQDPNTTLVVSSNGTLTAHYSEIGPGPVLGLLTVLPNPAFVGSLITFNVSVAGGTGPYHYGYSGLPGGCATNDTPVLTCTPTRAGRYFVSVTVTDALRGTVTGQISLEVLRPFDRPWIGAFFATHQPLLVGESTLLSVYVTGGVPPFHFYFSGLPPGCGSRDSGNVSCLPTQSGTFHVSVIMADAHGYTATATLLLQVGPSGNWLIAATENPGFWIAAAAGIGILCGAAGGWIVRGRRTRELRPEEPSSVSESSSHKR